MRRTYIGELEEVVLLIVVLLQKDAYGASIVKEIDHQLNRKISLSAVHATLHRLQGKGYVESFMGGATQERGGRRKVMYEATQLGYRTAEEAIKVKTQIWDTVPHLFYE